VISLDNYLDGSRVLEENFDDYRLVDFELLIKNITVPCLHSPTLGQRGHAAHEREGPHAHGQDLKEGRETELPLYDFRRSGRYGSLRVGPPDSQVVIVEGIYALHERVRHLVDLAISVSGGVHFDLIKRIFRGKDEASTPLSVPPCSSR